MKGVPETVTSGRPPPTSASPSVAMAALSSATAHEGVGAAEVVGERQMDHAVGRGGAGAKNVQIGQRAAQRLCAGGRGGPGRSLRAGERQDRVAVADEFGDDGGSDQSRGAGDEYPHNCAPIGDVSG
jgi:hypothetical protein